MLPRVALVDCGSRATPSIRTALEARPVDVHVVHLERGDEHDVLDSMLSLDPGAVVISGSEDHLWQPGARCLPPDFLALAVDRKLPVLGICYGHQMLASLGGGTVVANPAGAESGDVEVEVAAGHDGFPLFQGLGPRFKAFMKHHDIVSAVPAGWIVVASTALTRIAAFQVAVHGEPVPVYGVQFHPELSRARVKDAVFDGFLALARS